MLIAAPASQCIKLLLVRLVLLGGGGEHCAERCRPGRGGGRPDWQVESLGTIFGKPTVLDPILRELSALDVDPRVTLGPEASISDFGVGPERVTYEKFAPLAALLTGVDLVVAHGGAGTSLGVLASALPLVLAPQGADQFVVSERVAAAGAGIRILSGPTAPRDIASAVATVLADEHFRNNARTVAQHIAAMPSPAQLIETIVSKVCSCCP